ncbi:MAG TPA: ATP-binding protein [Candidatus Baltobacteraceae bacterium]|jgi:two-component system phosphate regulon sensor histidine kinase PhoR|nr:ATP-binding protein [Candidatus Baltobacteraceae bacterium]
MIPDVVAVGAFAAGVAGGSLIFWLTRRRRAPEYRQPEVQRQATSDERFDALVRALPLGVMMLDRTLRVRFANRAAAAIFGFERSLARGNHLIAAAPHIELEQRAQAALRGERFGTPIIINGKTVNRSYAVNVYPLISGTDSEEEESTDVSGVLVLAEDQTDLLALERARQEFLTNVSHELRTPLSSIKLMLETVVESDEDEAQQIFLPQALAQVDRLTTLVQRLLEQARVQSGKMVLDIREIDLEEVARPIVQSFEPQAASKGIELELRSLRPAIIEADEHRLSQIFVNLIDNALRYTAHGGAVTTTIDVDGAYAVIRVIDTGIGIPYKDIPYVFERFYVVDRSRARGFGGAGLGLAIVKEIVEAHHGEVSVESALGVGTHFTIRIPVVSVEP